MIWMKLYTEEFVKKNQQKYSFLHFFFFVVSFFFILAVCIEFAAPDFEMRQQIWKRHLPPSIKLSKDVDLQEIAMEFELTGMFMFVFVCVIHVYFFNLID